MNELRDGTPLAADGKLAGGCSSLLASATLTSIITPGRR